MPMPMRTRMVEEGQWLFRWRSYLPLLLLPLIVLAVRHARYVHFNDPLAQYGWESMCVVISVVGLLVRALAVGFAAPATSGRNTRSQRAASLNTTGMYSIVRHPLYLGNFLILEGFLLYLAVWWLALVGALVFWLYYERIMLAEEAFLESQFGETFVAWSTRTPAFVPYPPLWKHPDRPLCLRRMICNEYTTAMLLVLLFIVMQAVIWAWVDPPVSHQWGLLLAILTAALSVYQLTRYLKKRTQLLKPAGV